MNLMVQPNRLCLIVKLYINRPELLPDTHDFQKQKIFFIFALSGKQRATHFPGRHNR